VTWRASSTIRVRHRAFVRRAFVRFMQASRLGADRSGSARARRRHGSGEPGGGRSAPVLMVLGDSLSAGYGIGSSRAGCRCSSDGSRVKSTATAWSTPASVARPRRRARPAAASVDAPAAAGADRARRERRTARPAAGSMRANLSKLVALAQAAGARVLADRMRIPSNYGRVHSGVRGEFPERRARAQDRTRAVPARAHRSR